MECLHLQLHVTAVDHLQSHRLQRILQSLHLLYLLRRPVNVIGVDLRKTLRMTVVVQLHRHSVIIVKRWEIIFCRSGQARSVREIDLPEAQILYMHDSLTDKSQCTAVIATATTSVPVELTVDSGTSVSILLKILYDKHFWRDALQLPSIRLVMLFLCSDSRTWMLTCHCL